MNLLEELPCLINFDFIWILWLLSDWLIGWLVDWLIDWLIHCVGLCYIGEDLLMVSDTDNHLLRMINLKTQRYQDSFYQAEYRAISNDKMWTFYFYMLLNLTWLKNPVLKGSGETAFFKRKGQENFFKMSRRNV